MRTHSSLPAPSSCLLLLLPLLLPFPLVATAQGAAAGGFYGACYGTWSLGYHSRPYVLVATCAGVDGISSTNTTSALDLQDCLTNREGVLAAAQEGYAFNTCNSCIAATDSANITCQCRQTNGKYTSSTFDLDTVVGEDDGILECFGLPGFEVAPSAL